MNNKQNHTGPNYVTYIPKIHLNPKTYIQYTYN